MKIKDIGSPIKQQRHDQYQMIFHSSIKYDPWNGWNYHQVWGS